MHSYREKNIFALGFDQHIEALSYTVVSFPGCGHLAGSIPLFSSPEDMVRLVPYS